jgi:hypothetical protein
MIRPFDRPGLTWHHGYIEISIFFDFGQATSHTITTTSSLSTFTAHIFATQHLSLKHDVPQLRSDCFVHVLELLRGGILC